MRLGEFEPEEDYPHAAVNTSVINSPEHQAVAREVASASVIMAINKDNTLPIRSPLPTKTIAVVGAFANCGECYLHSYNGKPWHIAGYVEGVQAMANATGSSLKVSSNACSTYDGCVLEAVSDAASVASDADLVIAVVGNGLTEQEGGDRSTLLLPDCPGGCTNKADSQSSMLNAVRAAMKRPGQKLVVVLVSAGPVVLPDLDAYDAVLYAGYGGQAAGYGVADVMWGAVSPSARFPLTVYEADYLHKVGPILDYSTTSGVGRTYRYLNTTASPPIFWFGYGLSYSSFTYSNLTVHTTTTSVYNETVGIGSGGRRGGETNPTVVRVTATVTNNAPAGSPSWGKGAAEIPQLYVTVPRQPAPLPVPTLALQGFTKVQLAAASSVEVGFDLSEGQLCTVKADGNCTVFPGIYTVSVGGHQPGDVRGEATSNVVTGTFRLD